MSRKAAETNTKIPAAHPLPQAGGSFTVMAGQLVLDEYAQNAAASAEKTPDEPAVKPTSKEA